MIKSLRRITSNGKYIPEIDAMRFFAILPVVLMHANTNYLRYFKADERFLQSSLNHFIHQGLFGVLLFFSISGFVLSNNFADFYFLKKGGLKQYPFKQYYLRRLTRLEPPFIISTIILFFFVGYFFVGNFSQIIPNLVATLAYIHGIIYGKWSVINPVTWSLEIEIQFYLIAPILGWLFFAKLSERWRIILLIFLIIVSPLLKYKSILAIDNFRQTLPNFFTYFLIGILVSAIYKSNFWARIRSNYFFDFLAVGAFSGFFIFSISTYFQTLILSICMVFFMISSFKGVIFNKLMRISTIGIIGGMCYSIYLIHYAVIFGFMKITKLFQFENFYLNWGINISLSLVTILFFSVLFYKYCERPFMYKEWYLKWMVKLKNR